MFTTFNAQDDHDNQSRKSTNVRPRRSQVSRACDWCRVNRIKCDDKQPCRNCEARGVECCSSNRRGELRSLPQAVKENGRLKAQIKKLETQLQEKQEFQRSPPLSGTVTPVQDHSRNSTPNWEGAWTNSLPSTHRQLHGPSSSFYYIDRLGSFLGEELDHQEGAGENSVEQPVSASKVFAHPSSEAVDGGDQGTLLSDGSGGAEPEPLSYAQEDYFLSLFWESYFSNLPILDESDFRTHYQSLWTDGSHGQRRKPSPLVDIVLALCMQYGTTFIPRVSSDPEVRAKVDRNDSSLAGRGFFRRCQSLLVYEMERPSINTLQCHILSALYLRNASFTNMEHTTIAVAVRLAYLLGLHRRPPLDLPRKEQELRKRLFWCLYTVENKIGMTLGRPIFVTTSQQPSTDPETAAEAWSNSVTTIEGITFLQYQVEYGKLITAIRSVVTTFEDKCDSMLVANGLQDPYNNAQSFEDLAQYLSSHLHPLREWIEQCPAGLKTPRRGEGKRFSTDRSPLEIDPAAPFWLQRHRILLELLYHDQTMCLHRPFLRFSRTSKSSTNLADRMAWYCLQHAMAATHIIYQVLTESDILNGWHEAYKFTWNAATSLLGFIFAYPVHPSTQSARRALTTVIEIFEIFGNNFAVAASAAIITKNLLSKAETIMDRFRPTYALSSSSSSGVSSSIPAAAAPVSHHHDFSDLSISGGSGGGSGSCSDQNFAPITTTSVLAGIPAVEALPTTITTTSMYDPSIDATTDIKDHDFSLDMNMSMNMDMGIGMAHIPPVTHAGWASDGFGFQLLRNPFPDLNMTDGEGDTTGTQSMWPQYIGTDAEFGARSLL